MKRAILALALALLLVPAAMAQTLRTEYGYAIVISKYNHAIGIWGRACAGGELHHALSGEIHRSFPTGPKLFYGDERIPEGIYDGVIDHEGNISIAFYPFPGMVEFYRIDGPSLSRNVISVKGDMIVDIREVALAMRNKGFRSIPVVILPGELEAEVAERLGKAKNVRPGQTLDDVRRSVERWKHVERYLIDTGKIPALRFDGADIHIVETTPPALARR